jgi:hypothetical protein
VCEFVVVVVLERGELEDQAVAAVLGVVPLRVDEARVFVAAVGIVAAEELLVKAAARADVADDE